MERSIRKNRRTARQPYITPRSLNTRLDYHDGTSPGSNTSRVHFPNSQISSTSRIPALDTSLASTIDDEALEQSIDDDFGQVIVAIDMRESETIGCSYYSAQEETLYLMGDIRLAGNDTIDSCSYWVPYSL